MTAGALEATGTTRSICSTGPRTSLASRRPTRQFGLTRNCTNASTCAGRSRTDRRPAPPGELAEREHHRYPAQHRPGAVALLGQPRRIPLDLRADPRRPDPIDRLRLDEVLLQHGNFLSTSSGESNHHPNHGRYAPRRRPEQSSNHCGTGVLDGTTAGPAHNEGGLISTTTRRPSPPDTSPGSRSATAKPSRSGGTTASRC